MDSAEEYVQGCSPVPSLPRKGISSGTMTCIDRLSSDANVQLQGRRCRRQRRTRKPGRELRAPLALPVVAGAPAPPTLIPRTAFMWRPSSLGLAVVVPSTAAILNSYYLVTYLSLHPDLPRNFLVVNIASWELASTWFEGSNFGQGRIADCSCGFHPHPARRFCA